MSRRSTWSGRALLATSAVLLLGCTSVIDPDGPPLSDGDTQLPFPIDRARAPGEPATYKGLPLRLTDTGAPTVTAVDGLVGVVCVGMSNASQECADFIGRVTTVYAAAVNPSVRVVNCAVGGHAIERWIDTLYDATLWDDCIARKVPAAGLRPDQVRVLYHKAANQFTTGAGGAALPPYPAAGSDYENFVRNLGAFAGRVRAKFPAVQAVYTSSRSYGGFAGSVARGEPLSYEEGHALNTWLRDHTAVQGVWYGWGPYLWAPACGTGPTNGGGVCYDRADYVGDGVHPSASGTAKMSALLHARLLREAWYRR
jgi:hypothetical protein